MSGGPGYEFLASLERIADERKARDEELRALRAQLASAERECETLKQENVRLRSLVPRFSDCPEGRKRKPGGSYQED